MTAACTQRTRSGDRRGWQPHAGRQRYGQHTELSWPRPWTWAVPARSGDKSRCENSPVAANALTLRTRWSHTMLDSLRHWVSDMGVDGFHFDLAPVLGRDAASMPRHRFYRLAQDPVLSRVNSLPNLGRHRRLSEWSLSEAVSMEWNDKFRHVRGYWLWERSRPAVAANLRRRITALERRVPSRPACAWASVNFVAVHDGCYRLRHHTL